MATLTTTVTGTPVHPEEVPVTVYVVVAEGSAFTIEPVDALNVAAGLHVYAVPPEAVRLTLPPEQIAGDIGATLIVGVAFTVTTTVPGEALVHAPVVPVKLYVVVEPGDTLIVEPVKPPGCHVYVVAPLPVNLVELPEHIVEGPAKAVTVGVGFTVTTTVAGIILLQPDVVPITE